MYDRLECSILFNFFDYYYDEHLSFDCEYNKNNPIIRLSSFKIIVVLNEKKMTITICQPP